MIGASAYYFRAIKATGAKIYIGQAIRPKIGRLVENSNLVPKIRQSFYTPNTSD
jgi:hypothetical protein